MAKKIEETEQKPISRVYPKDSRKRLFSVLDAIIGFAEQKRILKGNSDKAKQNWSRIAVSSISAYGSLLKDTEMDDIIERIEKLENGANKKYE